MVVLFKALVTTSKFHPHLPAHILCFFPVTTGAESLAGTLEVWEILPLHPQKPESDTLKVPHFTCLQNQLLKFPLILVLEEIFGEAET